MPETDAELDAFFGDRVEARPLFYAVRALIEAIGPAKVRATKSQVAFSRRRGFAWTWTPDRYLRGATAPLVLSIALSRRDDSPRWKEVVEPRPGLWMHHLELRALDEIDDEVRDWVIQAAREAG